MTGSPNLQHSNTCSLESWATAQQLEKSVIKTVAQQSNRQQIHSSIASSSIDNKRMQQKMDAALMHAFWNHENFKLVSVLRGSLALFCRFQVSRKPSKLLAVCAMNRTKCPYARSKLAIRRPAKAIGKI